MDQSVIETMKRLYQFLRKILHKVDHPSTMQINLKECCMMFVEAWNLVEVFTLKRSWNKILNMTPMQESNEEIHNESCTED